MKKQPLIILIVIIIVALGAAGYYFIIKKPAKPIIWDGSYKMDGSLACTGNFPNLTTLPMTSDVTVSSNKITDQIQGTTKSFEIDKHGKATEIIDSMESQGVTGSGKAEYQFYQEKGVYKLTSKGTMELSATKSGKAYSSTCSGTVTGVKR